MMKKIARGSIQHPKLYEHVFVQFDQYFKVHNEYHQHVYYKDFTYTGRSGRLAGLENNKTLKKSVSIDRYRKTNMTNKIAQTSDNYNFQSCTSLQLYGLIAVV